jgi:hypothetical protein
MISKAIGSILLILALVIAVMLVTSGSPLLPHIVGPIALTGVSIFLLTHKTNAARPVE